VVRPDFRSVVRPGLVFLRPGRRPAILPPAGTSAARGVVRPERRRGEAI
jgi:hypothetical protein